jgi:hypothetical protein
LEVEDRKICSDIYPQIVHIVELDYTDVKYIDLHSKSGLMSF